MEPPARFDAQAVRSEKAEVLSAIQTQTEQEALSNSVRGQYRAGERLPSERDLAARFDTNRGAARVAIEKLEQLGIADVQPGGVRVRPIEDANLDVIGALLALDDVPDPDLMEQTLEVMGTLMRLAAKRALERATDSQVEHAREPPSGGVDRLHGLVAGIDGQVGRAQGGLDPPRAGLGDHHRVALAGGAAHAWAAGRGSAGGRHAGGRRSALPLWRGCRPAVRARVVARCLPHGAARRIRRSPRVFIRGSLGRKPPTV